MISKRNNLVAPIRLLTLIMGAIFTLLITKQLINIFGIGGYATYAVFTAIPSLIPFADLGLGLSVFNVYARQHSGYSLTREAKERISLAFYLICIFACFAIFVFFVVFNVPYFERFFDSNLAYLHGPKALLIICVTFLSTPLTLGFRKMYANGNVLKAILLSFLIPVINLIFTLLLIPHSKNIDQWIVFTPSMSYLLANLFAFINAKVYRDLVHLSLIHIKAQSGLILKFAMYSTLFSTLIAVMLQLPKFFFAHQNAQMNVAKYSILLLFGSSVGSLVSAYASVLVPTYKRHGFALEGRRYLLPTIRLVILLLLIGAVGNIYGPKILQGIFKIEFSHVEFFVSGIAVIVYLFWVFYNSFLTEMNDLRFLLSTGLLSSFSLFFTLYISRAQSYSICIVIIFLQYFEILLLVSIYRIFYFKETNYG
jgi:O-antigen/teichoic acid export membrane protein